LEYINGAEELKREEIDCKFNLYELFLLLAAVGSFIEKSNEELKDIKDEKQ
jgi:hypothetical protein